MDDERRVNAKLALAGVGGLALVAASASGARVVAVDVSDAKSREAERAEEEQKHRERQDARPGVNRIYNTVEDAMAATGTSSPSAALRHMKDHGHSARTTYLPHTGAKQRAKAARRAAKIAEQMKLKAEGDVCGLDGCKGILTFKPVVGCTCFLGHPPCAACVASVLHCATCHWEGEPPP